MSKIPLGCLPALLYLTGAGCSGGEDQSAADLTMPVVVEKVKRAAIAKYVSTTGTLRAQREEAVVAQVQGILRLASTNGTVLAAGTRVGKNQLLAEIENREYLLEIRVESQKLALANAERELEKQEGLFKEGGVTEKELEISRKNALDARLNYEAAELKAEKLKLRAPIVGVITNFQANFENAQVAAGFQLCKIMDYTTTTVEVNLPNSDIALVQIGQKVKVQNYALQDEVFAGRLVALDPTIDPQTRTFKATVEVANAHLKLRPGMFVKADVVVEDHPQAVVIPKNALQTRDGAPVVFVVAGVSAEMREVRTGIETKEEIEILEGLSEGERLVVKGQETLRDKSKVRVTE